MSLCHSLWLYPKFISVPVSTIDYDNHFWNSCIWCKGGTSSFWYGIGHVDWLGLSADSCFRSADVFYRTFIPEWDLCKRGINYVCRSGMTIRNRPPSVLVNGALRVQYGINLHEYVLKRIKIVWTRQGERNLSSLTLEAIRGNWGVNLTTKMQFFAKKATIFA